MPKETVFFRLAKIFFAGETVFFRLDKKMPARLFQNHWTKKMSKRLFENEKMFKKIRSRKSKNQLFSKHIARILLKIAPHNQLSELVVRCNFQENPSNRFGEKLIFSISLKNIFL